MGKKAPAAVSSDDRLKEAVLVLLKQQQTAEEVGRDVIESGAIKIGSKDEEAPTEPGPAELEPTSGNGVQSAVKPPSTTPTSSTTSTPSNTPTASTPVTPSAKKPDAKAATEAAGLEYASKMTKSSIRKEDKPRKTTNSSNV